MTDTNQSDAKNLITLAERMGIPVDEAIRQVALLIADPDYSLPDGLADRANCSGMHESETSVIALFPS
jgi:hypothetical protein